MDVFSPVGSRGSWRTIFQTNTTNSNDADYFIRNSDDTVGVAAIGYSGTPIDEASWSRLVITFENGTDARAYIDGSLIHTHTAPDLDGRHSLDPTFLLFGDNDGDNAALAIGGVGFFEGVLTAGEVSSLGVAGAPIIPEPSGLALLGVGLLAFLRRRR